MTAPRTVEGFPEDTQDDLTRTVARSKLNPDHVGSERAAAYRIAEVARNTATADRMGSFEKLLRSDEDFQQQAHAQLRELVAQNEEEETEDKAEEVERLYFALGRVLVEEKRLPPHGPVLLRGDVLGAGKRPKLLPSAEDKARDRKWHPIAKGTATTEETRHFQYEFLTNHNFINAVDFAGRLCLSESDLILNFERDMGTRLQRAMEPAVNLSHAIQAEAVSKVGGRPLQGEPGASGASTSGGSVSGGNVSGGSTSGGSASGGRDRARRDPVGGASPAQSNALPAGWTVTFVDMIATRTVTKEMIELFQHKFETEKDFQQQVVAQDRKYRSSKSIAGYAKAVWLRTVTSRCSDERQNLLAVDTVEGRPLQRMLELLTDMEDKSGSVKGLTVSMPPRPDGTVLVLRHSDVASLEATAAQPRNPRSGKKAKGGKSGEKSTNKPKRR